MTLGFGIRIDFGRFSSIVTVALRFRRPTIRVARSTIESIIISCAGALGLMHPYPSAKLAEHLFMSIGGKICGLNAHPNLASIRLANYKGLVVVLFLVGSNSECLTTAGVLARQCFGTLVLAVSGRSPFLAHCPLRFG